jgi:uncharacterized protein
MTRVVLDTNVVVSAYLNPGGAPGRVVQLALAGLVRWRLCEEIVAEYREVLGRFESRPKSVALFLN